jgi:hypothetical protein
MGGVGEQDDSAAQNLAGLRLGGWATAVLIVSALIVSACQSPGGYGSDPRPTQSLDLRAPQPMQTTRVSPQAPFLGSPANKYADGADGIALPKAKAVAGFSVSQVRANLKAVKLALVRANLDKRIWSGKRPTALINMFEPSGGLRSKIERSFKHPSDKQNPLSYATRFDPKVGSVHGQIVKVRGKMSFRGVERGRLRVHTDYLFVYAVRQSGSASRVERVVVRRTTDYEFYNPALFQATPGKMWLHNGNFSSANAECDQSNGYIRPSFSDVAEPGQPEPSGIPEDPYDMSKEETSGDEGCHRVTRT